MNDFLTFQNFPEWEHHKKKSIQERMEALSKEGRPYSIIFSRQFSRALCEELFGLADHIRSVAKSKEGLDFLRTILSDKRAMLFFAQPSTRTFLSFQNACHILGMKVSEIRDTSTSSEVKGESPEDTIRTFSSYVDLIVMRHREEGYAERSAWLLSKTKRSVPVINGGSGKDEHPTQALLDLYTLFRAFRKQKTDFQDKKIAFVGDLKRGRTVRSLSLLLTQYPGVHLVFIAPLAFQISQDILEILEEQKISFEVEQDFEKQISRVDAIYMTRIQDEYDSAAESKAIDFTRYHFKKEHLNILKPTAVLMHPFPRRLEIDVACDSDPRAAYWKQERNGMWIRAALMLKILGRESKVLKDF